MPSVDITNRKDVTTTLTIRNWYIRWIQDSLKDSIRKCDDIINHKKSSDIDKKTYLSIKQTYEEIYDAFDNALWGIKKQLDFDDLIGCEEDEKVCKDVGN